MFHQLFIKIVVEPMRSYWLELKVDIDSTVFNLLFSAGLKVCSFVLMCILAGYFYLFGSYGSGSVHPAVRGTGPAEPRPSRAI